MSLIRRVVGGTLPVGSLRRSRVVQIARAVGGLGPGRPSSYQRWINAVEPRLFHPPERAMNAVELGISFHISVVLGAASAAEVERTLVSLGDQTYPGWTASFVDWPPDDAVAKCLDRVRASEGRVVDTQQGGQEQFCVQLRAGDMLARQALVECAIAIEEGFGDDQRVMLITSDHDDLNQFGDRRTTPRRHRGADIDGLRQYDPLSGLVVRHSSLDATAASALALAIESAASGTLRHRHLPHFLLHRRHQVGPIQRVLAGTDIDAVASSVTSSSGKSSSVTSSSGKSVADVHTGGPQMGTQIRWRDFGDAPRETPLTVGLIITSPLGGDIANNQRADLRAQVERANLMLTALDAPVVVVISDRTLDAFPCATDVVAELDAMGASMGCVFDGALRVRSADLFPDLIAVALRKDVFAVAPIVVSPSNIAIDAGLDVVDTPVARCGPLRRAPYELLWTRGVASLSGRCLVAKTAELRRLGGRTLNASGLHSFLSTSPPNPTRLVIWAHHQVEATYGIRSSADTAAVLPWREDRLMTWFGADIASYSPLNDSDAESFW